MIKKIKKGVSPIIATVLLIGMVIVLGLIVFTWMRALSKEAVTKFDGENVEIICRRVNFDVEYSEGIISIVNRANVPIYQMKVKVISSGGHELVDISNLISQGEDSWHRYGLDAEDSFSARISTQGAREMVFIPVLLGEGEKDKKKFTCEESAGRKISIL